MTTGCPGHVPLRRLSCARNTTTIWEGQSGICAEISPWVGDVVGARSAEETSIFWARSFEIDSQVHSLKRIQIYKPPTTFLC